MAKVIPLRPGKPGFLQRWGNRRRASLRSRAAFRVAEMIRLFEHRYGSQLLPDDEAGREDLNLVADELLKLNNPEARVVAFVETCAPWLPAGELAKLLKRFPRPRRADAMGRELNLRYAERKALLIRTIAAIDITKHRLAKIRKEEARQRAEEARRLAGAIPRKEYEDGSDARLKPWLALRMSRRTWYRKGKPKP